MKSGLPDIPGMKSFSSVVPAPYYNRVRLALKRFGQPLQLVLPGMRGFEMCLDDDAWVCTDRNLNFRPMLAWTGFKNNARTGLSEPVECQVIYYHAYANIVVRTALSDLDRKLEQRLRHFSPKVPGRILSLGNFRSTR